VRGRPSWPQNLEVSLLSQHLKALPSSIIRTARTIYLDWGNGFLSKVFVTQAHKDLTAITSIYAKSQVLSFVLGIPKPGDMETEGSQRLAGQLASSSHRVLGPRRDSVSKHNVDDSWVMKGKLKLWHTCEHTHTHTHTHTELFTCLFEWVLWMEMYTQPAICQSSKNTRFLLSMKRDIQGLCKSTGNPRGQEMPTVFTHTWI